MSFMTMQDPIPGKNEQYQPFIDTNHDHVATELAALIGDDRTLTSRMESLIAAQLLANKELFEKLTQIGYYFIPVTDEGELTDDTRYRDVHAVATTCALTCLDLLCNELCIDKIQFRDIWLKSGLLTIVDLNHELLADKPLRDKHDSVVQGVIELGNRALVQLPDEYSLAADVLSDDPLVLEHANLFKAVFGHVLDGGYKILSKLNDINRAHAMDFEKEIAQFINQPAEFEGVNIAGIDHVLIADQLDTQIFYGEEDEGFESVVGEFTGEMLDLDSDVPEICNTLAWAAYSKGYEYGSLDQNGESFFSGMMLAFKALDMTTSTTGIELYDVLRYWKRQYAHKKLLKFTWADEAMQQYATQQIDKQLLARSATMGAYLPLLEKICKEHEFEDDEAIIFTKGFEYTIGTGMRTLSQHNDALQDEFVKAQTENINDELEELLKQGLE